MPNRSASKSPLDPTPKFKFQANSKTPKYTTENSKSSLAVTICSVSFACPNQITAIIPRSKHSPVAARARTTTIRSPKYHAIFSLCKTESRLTSRGVLEFPRSRSQPNSSTANFQTWTSPTSKFRHFVRDFQRDFRHREISAQIAVFTPYFL